MIGAGEAPRRSTTTPAPPSPSPPLAPQENAPACQHIERSTSTCTSRPQQGSGELVCEEQLQASQAQARVLPGAAPRQRASCFTDLVTMIRWAGGVHSARSYPVFECRFNQAGLRPPPRPAAGCQHLVAGR